MKDTQDTTRKYLVLWTIEVDARDAQEAARLALEAQRDPDSLAARFHVFGPGTTAREVAGRLTAGQALWLVERAGEVVEVKPGPDQGPRQEADRCPD